MNPPRVLPLAAMLIVVVLLIYYMWS